MMNQGLVQVLVPDTVITRAARWCVRAGPRAGKPGEKIPVPVGELIVTVETEVAVASIWACGTLTLHLRVAPGSLTRIDLGRTLAPAVLKLC